MKHIKIIWIMIVLTLALLLAVSIFAAGPLKNKIDLEHRPHNHFFDTQQSY